MIDKKNDKFIMFCNECTWKEETTGLLYEFCHKCGHVNIGFVKNHKSNGEKKEVN